MFRIKPHTHQRCSEGSKKPCAHQDPETPQRLSQNCVECLLWRDESAVACCRHRGSGCSRPGYGISPHGGGCHKPHHRAASTYTGLGKQTPGENKQNLVCTRIQENRIVTSQETDPDLPLSVLESLAEAWVGSWPAAGLGARSAAVCAQGILKEVAMIFITSTIVWPQVKQQGGNTAPINRKLD